MLANEREKYVTSEDGKKNCYVTSHLCPLTLSFIMSSPHLHLCVTTLPAQPVGVPLLHGGTNLFSG